MANQKYVDENREGSLLTFNKRKLYDAALEDQQDEYRNLVDFNLGEKFLYGRVSRDFMPMYADAGRLRGLGTFNGAHQDTAQIVAFNFVIDAFKDLQNQFDKQVSGRKINPNHEFLSNLKIYKAYLDPIDLFINHQDTYTAQIKQHFTNKKIKVKNFSEFIKHFMDLISKSAFSYPFTFSGFIKSKYCPINCSGLVIEIAEEDYFKDTAKIDSFVNSENWLFFLNACRSYGFSVDKNIPWRLVADIGSPEMLEYARNYNVVNTNAVISSYYRRCDVIYFNKFRLYLHNLYHNVILDSITEFDDCNGQTISRTIVPERYSIQQLEKILDDRKLLQIYFDIRTMEEEKKLKKDEKARLYRDCLAIEKYKTANAALFTFETVINHPFDYNGSLSYLIDRTKKGYEGREIVIGYQGPRS